jgi:metal-sulfur cluster biosynthetic enzyme
MTEMLLDDARQVLAGLLPAGAEVELNLVGEPPWTPDKMGEYARHFFGWE